MNSLQIPGFRGKLTPEDSFPLTRNWTKGQSGLLLWIISSMENMLHAESFMDEEMDLEEHKSRMSFVVIILMDGSFDGK